MLSGKYKSSSGRWELRPGWWKVGGNGGKGGSGEGVRSEGFLSSPERRGEDAPNPRPTESSFEKSKILKVLL